MFSGAVLDTIDKPYSVICAIYIHAMNPVSPQNSPANPQKSATLPQKSPMFPQEKKIVCKRAPLDNNNTTSVISAQCIRKTALHFLKKALCFRKTAINNV